MNEKITFNELKDRLATDSGYSREVCDAFLRNLFGEISAALVAGEQVKVKGLGTFKLIDIEPRMSVNIATGEPYEIPGHKRATFTPDKELAKNVNGLNEAFSAQEVGEKYEDSDPDTLSEEKRDAAPNIVEPDPGFVDDPAADNSETEPENEKESVVTPQPYISDQEEKPEDAEGESEPVAAEDQSDNEQEDPPVGEPVPDEDPYEEAVLEQFSEPVKKREKNSSGFWLGFLAGFAVCAVACAVAFGLFEGFSNYDDFKNALFSKPHALKASTMADSEQKTDTVALKVTPVKTEAENSSDPKIPETTAKPTTQPSDTPVYDTITKTRYLTTMARRHYGNYHLWPYIYEENKAILGHPDRIKPGTRVVIPDLAKYGVNPNSKDDIEAAKRKGAQIYARYK